MNKGDTIPMSKTKIVIDNLQICKCLSASCLPLMKSGCLYLLNASIANKTEITDNIKKKFQMHIIIQSSYLFINI